MDSREQLQSLVTGYRISAAIAVAADLGLSDALVHGPCSAEDLAATVSADPDSLLRLLRALTAVGIYEEADGRFSLTSLGQWLRSDVTGSLGPLAKTLVDPALWGAWGHLGHSVRTGETAFEALHGVDVWTHRERHPEQNAVFNANMAALSARVAGSVAATYDFSEVASVVDVGGGLGVLLEAVLARHEHLTGTVFDQDHVVGRVPPSGDDSLVPRWSAQSGDFFAAVPPADCLMLKSILHDWSDERCIQILDSCRRSLRPGGVVLVVERVLGRPGYEVETAMSDVNMLVLPGGRERTEPEYAELLASAGLGVRRVIHTTSPVSIIEAVPA
jgi:hypothetical protein